MVGVLVQQRCVCVAIDMSTEKGDRVCPFYQHRSSPWVGLRNECCVCRGRSLSRIVVGMSSTKQADVFRREGGGRYVINTTTNKERLILFWGSTQRRGWWLQKLGTKEVDGTI